MDKDEMLEPLNIDVGRVLAVAAHPDDIEYDSVAAVAIWTSSGHEVGYLLASRGEAGIEGIEPAKAGPIREAEERASAAKVGVRNVNFLGYPDGTIQQSLELRRDICRKIRRFKPQTLLLTNHRETWPSGYPNSADHRNVGQAALDAVGDAANRWIFPEPDGSSCPKSHSVQQILIADSPLSAIALDVSSTVDKAMASLLLHETYINGLGVHPMADPEYLRRTYAETSKRLPGSSAAIAFELIIL